MEIVLLKTTEIGSVIWRKGDRLKVTNHIARKLIKDKSARAYPNIIENIENKLNRIIKTKVKEK